MGSLRTLRRNAPKSDFISGSSCTVSEQQRTLSRQLADIFGVPEDYFARWPLQPAEEVLHRAQTHGCADCHYQQDFLCLQSEEETNFPQDCPGFRRG